MEQTQRAPFRMPRGGDHDEPFDGYRPSHFTLKQQARLLLLRSRVQEARLGEGALADDLGGAA